MNVLPAPKTPADNPHRVRHGHAETWHPLDDYDPPVVYGHDLPTYRSMPAPMQAQARREWHEKDAPHPPMNRDGRDTVTP